jgi:type II secretory pathway component PulF
MGISTKKLAQLCRRVGMGHRAGLDMRTIWQKESEHGSPAFRGRMLMVSQRVAGGGSLGEALASTGSYFPPFLCAMTQVGEQTGRLDETFLKLADHYDQTIKLRRSFLMGILWPMIQLTIALILVPLGLWIVMSIFSIEVDILGIGLTGSRAFLTYFAILAIIVGLGIAGFFVLRHFWGASMIAKYLGPIPLIGPCVRLTALSRLAWSLSLANGAGMDIRSAMRLALDSTQNGWLASERETIDRRLLAGDEVHATLRATRQYPDEFLAALETGEMTGQISESMAHVANDYQARLQALSHTLTVVASVVIWGMVALLIIIMIFRIAMFIMSVYSEAGAQF